MSEEATQIGILFAQLQVAARKVSFPRILNTDAPFDYQRRRKEFL
jgi:hypothetical protein